MYNFVDYVITAGDRNDLFGYSVIYFGDTSSYDGMESYMVF